MIQERKEYKDSWELPEAQKPDAHDEFAMKGEVEEQALSKQLNAGGGEKVAGLDIFGHTDLMSPAERKAYKDSTGHDIHWEPPAPELKAGYNPGKDDQMTLDWKARTKDAKHKDGVQKLMKLRGLTQDQAEREMQGR